MLQNALVQRWVERVTKGVKTIDTDHSYIHDGNAYGAFVKNTLATGATRKITFLTPETGYIHYRTTGITPSADAVTVNFYEGSSGNSGGNTITQNNYNRNSANTSGVTIKDGVTVSTNGTLFASVYLPGSTGVGQTRSNAVVTSGNERVLKPNTLYTIETVNGSSANNTIQIDFFFYKETRG